MQTDKLVIFFCYLLRRIGMICCWIQAFCMNAFSVSRRDMRPRCRLMCVHFSSGKGKGAVILWETPVCLLRSPTINPVELKAGHHTDSIRWGGWRSAPWLPGYWLCFYLCALNWREWGREQAGRIHTSSQLNGQQALQWKKVTLFRHLKTLMVVLVNGTFKKKKHYCIIVNSYTVCCFCSEEKNWWLNL